VSILSKTMFAFRDAMEAKAWTWPASIRAGISRGPLDDDETASPASNPLPSIIANASTASQITPQIANFEVSVSVEIRHQADDSTPDDHLQSVAEVADWIHGDSFISDLSAYSGFTAFGRGNVNQSFDQMGRKWVTRFEFQLTAAPSDIS
jgi:hypothetical protein